MEEKKKIEGRKRKEEKIVMIREEKEWEIWIKSEDDMKWNFMDKDIVEERIE